MVYKKGNMIAMSLVIDRISMNYGHTKVLDNVSAIIQKGEFLSILGHSGCGKTTLLKILAGFIKPAEGQILLHDVLYSNNRKIVSPGKRDMGMVFQSFALWPHMTIRQHIEFPLQCRSSRWRSKKEQEKAVENALEITGLTELQQRYPHQLSGGQRQRVSLARAIAARPSLLLMDEPLSALDIDLRVSMRKEIRRIHQLIGTTVIFVTHDQGEALSLSDRIMVLHKGCVEQIGTPEEIYLHPQTPFTAAFIGRCNFIKGEWQGTSFHSADGKLFYQGDIADIFHQQQICPLRPEQLHIIRSGSGLAGIIKEKQYIGREIHYVVSCKENMFNVYAPTEENYAIGEELYLNCQ
ncbi:ABC transporter ATP-binding protein [Megasphaera paucivorans]|nr:ABC transporter ATP-binding protein [Megasphaera paucivorans]